jgi:hypothetical protein
MSQSLPGPERIYYLESYIKGCKSAERRILIAGQRVNGYTVDLTKFFVQKPLILHIEQTMRREGFDKFTRALWLLRLARSKFAMELEGYSWRATKNSPKTCTNEPRKRPAIGG